MTASTRRQFLRSAAAAAAAAQLPLDGAIAAPSRARRAAAGGRVGERAWRELERRLQGRVLRPGESGYARASLPFNRRYADVLPAGIARCAGEDDVREAVVWAREHDVPLAARSGGHSYAGYSTTRGLLIDLGAMRSVRVDDEAGTVVAQAGARTPASTPRCSRTTSRSPPAAARRSRSAGWRSAAASASPRARSG